MGSADDDHAEEERQRRRAPGRKLPPDRALAYMRIKSEWQSPYSSRSS